VAGRAWLKLSEPSGTMQSMDDRAELLMRTGIVQVCSDCAGERIFVSISECDADRCEFCCTTCGAAVVIDPVCDYSVVSTRVA
jgi:hypothetical protein